MMKTQITNDFDALVQALTLAITASTNDQLTRATEMVDHFSLGMDEPEIERAKKLAQKNVEQAQ